jgi:catechol 2,3-dioxygenase-like lactoylglutathione lyase family enzyme
MIKGVSHITLAVSDLHSSMVFYSQILGFKAHVSWDKGAYLSLQNLWLCLSVGEPRPSEDYSHIAWSVDQTDFCELRDSILSFGAKEWKSNTSEGESFYFLDPDGNKLEIHVGDLQQRLASLKRKPYKGLKWL